MTTEALESVVRRYADMVYRLALAQTRSPADADDIFQDVFLRYAERSPDFRSEEHRKAWLLRVTVNRCRTHFRSPWFRRMAPLDEAVASLPARYRAVVHLHYFEALSTEEIAAATGQRASTVRSQLTRARAILRDMLKGGID